MRFKSIFWLFNIVVLLALIVFAVSSFFLFGKDYPASLGSMWIVMALFVLLIGTLDFYFLRNWALFDLLENEDWAKLNVWLEDKIYTRGRLNRPYAALLINTALSLGKLDVLETLEKEVREKKPSLLGPLGVSLGIPMINAGDREAIVEYFGALADKRRTTGRDWARWCRAMASGNDGADELLELLESRDLSIRILSYNLLADSLMQLDSLQSDRLNKAVGILKNDISGLAGEKALLKSRESHLMAVVLTSSVTQAREKLGVAD